ncbi:GNAT family N-acetyltransferase [Mycolicibacterium mageritense]|uniref:GNAT family N-acetyltransferase n=1 Tax=Mycolicibacterium mageritense TaxID=53462 RepID=UPI001E60CBE6|nr:GNAT family N-acetyltransferase [Mycolicibacterium mageritense]
MMADCSRIRQAVVDDAVPITRIVTDAYTPYVDRIGRSPAPMGVDYHALVTQTDHVRVLADVDGVAGVIVLVPEADHLLIENVAVAPRAQGRGYGRSLLRYAEQQARLAGYGETRLYTNVAMVENLALYSRLGYVEVDRRHEDGFDRVYLAKSVAAPQPGSE